MIDLGKIKCLRKYKILNIRLQPKEYIQGTKKYFNQKNDYDKKNILNYKDYNIYNAGN